MMKEKNIISKKNISILLLILVLLLTGGCASSSANSSKSSETQEIEQIPQKLYENLDDIYFWYICDNESIIHKEFDKFLKNKFGDEKEHILECFENWREDKIQTYRTVYAEPKEKLLKELSSDEISTEEFDEQLKILRKNYNKEKPNLKSFFTEKEREVFESSKEDIEVLCRFR